MFNISSSYFKNALSHLEVRCAKSVECCHSSNERILEGNGVLAVYLFSVSCSESLSPEKQEKEEYLAPNKHTFKKGTNDFLKICRCFHSSVATNHFRTMLNRIRHSFIVNYYSLITDLIKFEAYFVGYSAGNSLQNQPE